MTDGHLRADCLYTGISSGPHARYRACEVFTFFRLQRLSSNIGKVVCNADQWRRIGLLRHMYALFCALLDHLRQRLAEVLFSTAFVLSFLAE